MELKFYCQGKDRGQGDSKQGTKLGHLKLDVNAMKEKQSRVKVGCGGW